MFQVPPRPNAEEQRILDAFRDQKPIEIDGALRLVVEVRWERVDDPRCALRYTSIPTRAKPPHVF